MKRIFVLLLELLLVTLAVFAADRLQATIDFIPRWLIHLPAVDYEIADFWTVLKYFLAVHAVVLVLAQLFMGPWQPADARRTVNELFVLAVAFAIASLLLFVTTTIAFDPQFVVGIVMLLAAAVLLIHFIAAIGSAGVIGAFGNFFAALVRRTFSIPGIIAIVLALSPGILAKLFVSDRDVANVITQIRIKMSTDVESDWVVENAVGGQQFSQPILVQFPPGVSDTMYVLERQGRLYRMPWRRAGEPELVLDISDRVGEVEVENGALGFDFHPSFGRVGSKDAGHIYLYYTSVLNGQQFNKLSRFDLTGADLATRADSEQVLIDWDRSEDGFHNGGSVEFGPDGFLYIGIGEMSDKHSHQRIDRGLSGGVFRIDVDRRGGDISQPIARLPDSAVTGDYYIPKDNPFIELPGALGEFYALGLRNPFRISFDRETGALWAGDVGSTVWEEVNLIKKGGNYQYPLIEGREATGATAPWEPLGQQYPPLYTYRHTAYERAVIGGLVYRGDRYPALRGKYLFGDNYSGNLYAMPADGKAVESVEFIAQANQYAQRGITSFTETPDGEILLTTLGSASGSSGEIIHLLPRGQEQKVAATAPAVEPDVSPAEAQALFGTNCSRCHGLAGEADGPDTAHLGVPVPIFATAEFQRSRSDEHLYKVIDKGGMALGLSPMMPPWGMAMTDKEITALVKLIRGYGSAEGEAQ